MPELGKNQIYTAEIVGCTSEGQGVARIDGRAIFVKGALPGEVCRIRILKVTKTAVYAKIEDMISASPNRIQPDCPNFGKCGGCDFRHVRYEEELRIKLQRVNDAFQRIGGLSLTTEEILSADHVERYRSKAVLSVGQRNGSAISGFYRSGTHEVIPVEDCLLQTNEANAAARILRQWMDEYRIDDYNEKTGKGFIRHLFVRSGMICLVSFGRPPKTERLVERLRAGLDRLKSVILNINRSEGNTILNGSFETLWGSDTVDVMLSGLSFRLSPQSFFQVNPAQAEKLYAKAIELAGLHGTERVIDLYCGAGAIGLLAAHSAESVLGVEIVPDAVKNARENMERNKIKNIEFICADAASASEMLASEGRRADVLFVDPPRKGLAESVISDIAKIQPDRVVYVSCDPGTLARDLKRFAGFGYAAQKAVAVDMFPRTRHVETVVLMSRVM